MVLIENWMPPSRENWELLVNGFRLFPLLTLLQWVIPWYGAGKTSGQSILDIPGKIAWGTMESFGPATLIYVMTTLPKEIGLKELPWQNKLMASLFVIHYIYRAILSPILNPSMSPIHIIVWAAALIFQLFNATSIGGWLGGYGPTTQAEWHEHQGRLTLGLFVFIVGLAGNIYHDEALREVRRKVLRKQAKDEEEKAKGTNRQTGSSGSVNKHYVIPEGGLFSYIFYPHYLLEWIEWSGYWIMGGPRFIPAQNFFFNELATMFPRALQGKTWYLKKFGKEKVGGRKAIIPGLM